MGAAERISPVGLSVHGVAMTAYDCWNCGVIYAVPNSVQSAAKQSGTGIHCPHGHLNYWGIGESVADRQLREARERAERAEADALRQREAREWAEKQAKGANIAAGLAKGKLRRVHERIHAGVCPHCNRTFKQLAAHMKSKHGDEL